MPARSLTAVLGCLAWLVVSTTYAAGAHAAEPAIDVGGRELPGGEASTDPADPVELTAGLWADELGPESSAQSTHYFRYERRIADSTVHVGVLGASRDREDTDGLELGVAADGEECAGASAKPAYPHPQASFGASVDVGADEAGSRDSVCLSAATLDLAVTRSSASSASLPVAIAIVEEAPATGVGDLPEPEEDATAEPVSSDADPERLDGGTAPDTAPELDPGQGGVVVDTVVTEGEERLFRVPLTWGQRLEATARVPAQAEPAEGEYNQPAMVDLSFVTPMRRTFQSVVSDASPTVQYYDEAGEAWDATPRVTYRNRFDGTPAALAGDHWIAVAVSPADADAEPLDVPIELTLVVDGEESGVPTYPETVTAPGGASGPGGYDADTPYLVGDGEFAAVPSGSGDNGFWSLRRWSGIGLGVLSLALLGTGLVRLLGRRA